MRTAIATDRDAAATVDAALGPGTAATPIGDGEREDRLIHWLQEREMAHRHLVYVADAAGGHWSRRCMRQADRVLVLADSRQPPRMSALIEDLRSSGLRTEIELLLVRPDQAPAGAVLEWRALISSLMATPIKFT